MFINSSKALGKYLNVSQPTISRWRDKGMPYRLEDGLKYCYDLGEVLRWLIERSPRHRRWVEQLKDKLAEM